MVNGALRLHRYVVNCKRKIPYCIRQSIYLFRVKNSRSLHKTFNVEPLYLQHENSGLAIDYMVNL